MLRRTILALLAVAWFGLAHGAAAAEVLQVRSGTLLQVGDHNRTYTVELACLTVPTADEQAAVDWLRTSVPRRTKVNLRPVGNENGVLLAHVQPLSGSDLGNGLIDAGLASPRPDCR